MKLSIVLSPRAYMAKSSEFLQVPEPIQRGKRLPLSRPPQTLALPKPPAISLQGELEAHMWETVRRVTPRTLLSSVLRQRAVFEGGGSSEYFQVSRLI